MTASIFRTIALVSTFVPMALTDNNAAVVVWGPSADIVESHTNGAGLENGQVAFSLDEERNPPRLTSIDGIPYFGGVVSDGHVDVWRILNNGPDSGNDAIDFLASGVPGAGQTSMLILWKCYAKADGKYPMLQAKDPFFVRGFFSGSSVDFRANARFVVLDGGDQWWVSEETTLPNKAVEITRESLAVIRWSAYDPKVSLFKIGDKRDNAPESVKAVGILFSIANRSEEAKRVGGSITAFRANLTN